jgi:long-chain acyl-CoA synthetase
MAFGNVYEERPWLRSCPEIPAEIQISTKSVNEAFDEATVKWKDRTAIIFYGKKISYGELREKVDRFATALSRLGVKKGERVAFLLLNSPEHIIAFYGAVKLGAVITPISPVYVSSEIKHQLVDSGAETLICQDILYKNFEETGVKTKNVILTNIADSLPFLKKTFGKSIVREAYQKSVASFQNIFRQEGYYQFQDLINNYSANPPGVEINPAEDLLTLPYTGGTTGLPKGVMITHQNVIANLAQYHAFYPFLKDGEEIWLAYMPFYHAAGQVLAVVGGILHGYTLVTLTTPDPDHILNSLTRFKVSSFFGAPAIYEILKAHKNTERVMWKKLKIVTSGADALHEETAKEWKARTGITLYEGYGMTELTLVSHANPLGKVKLGSVGVPMSNTTAAILDPEKDEFLPMSERGEIVIRGPQVTKGYFNNPEATKQCQALVEGKIWWRTGDIGSMDQDGYFYFYDRKRDLIKYKGLRVYAREVEEVLRTHPKIKEVGVIGVPDIKVGENVKAVVVLESDARGKLSEGEIIDYCKDKLAQYKIPKIVEFAGEIPRTDMGKVSRREIREGEV